MDHRERRERTTDEELSGPKSLRVEVEHGNGDDDDEGEEIEQLHQQFKDFRAKALRSMERLREKNIERVQRLNHSVAEKDEKISELSEKLAHERRAVFVATAEIDRLNEERDSLQTAMNRLKEESDVATQQLRKDVEKLLGRVARRDATIQSLDRKRAEEQGSINEKVAEIDALNTVVAELRERLEKTKRAAEEQRNQSEMKERVERAREQQQQKKLADENHDLLERVKDHETEISKLKRQLDDDAGMYCRRIDQLLRDKSSAEERLKTANETKLANESHETAARPNEQEEVDTLMKQLEEDRNTLVRQIDQLKRDKSSMGEQLKVASTALAETTVRLTRDLEEKREENETLVREVRRLQELSKTQQSADIDPKKVAALKDQLTASQSDHIEGRQRAATTSGGHDSTPPTTDNTICSICLDGVRDTALLPCGHTFCKNCPTSWQNQRRYTCPYCKADVEGQLKIFLQ